MAHPDISNITALGIDENASAKGHTYLTLVYVIGSKTKRLLAVAEEPSVVSLRSCLESLGDSVYLNVKYVYNNVRKPYLNAIAEKLGEAVHVFDRFHMMQMFGKALDEIRAEEAKRIARDAFEAVLKKLRWHILKRSENLTDKQTVMLSELLKYNLRTVRAYLVREEFQRLWEYKCSVSIEVAQIDLVIK